MAASNDTYGRNPFAAPSPTTSAPATARDDSLSPTNASNKQPETQTRPRRGSFSFLRRSKSREGSIVQRSASGNKIVRRTKSLTKEEIARRNLQMPPSLPSYHQLPSLNVAETPLQPSGHTTNNSNNIIHATQYPPSTASSTVPASRSGYRPNAFYQRHLMAERSASQNIPVPPIPDSSASSFTDGIGRHESMTNRGRYSYANSTTSPGINSPRRVRRRKDPTPFNILVVGTKNCGKTSLIDFLRKALARPLRSRHNNSPSPPSTAAARPDDNPLFVSQYLETELEGERIGLTLYDSNGLERHLIDLQQRELSFFLESKFQETFNEEQKVLRATGIRDTHIHCTFLVLDPSRLDQSIASNESKNRNGGLLSSSNIIGALDKELDVDVLRMLQGKTTVIPVISKADIITTAHMSYLKRVVWDSLKKIKIDPLEVLNIDSDDDEGSAYETAISTGGDDDSNADADLDTVDTATSSDPQESEVVNNLAEPKSAKASSDKKVKPKATNGVEASNLMSLPPQLAEPNRLSNMSINVNLPLLPMSVISPDKYDPSTIGRRFAWGFADPYNDEHCDFVRLMDSVFSEWRSELRTAARERWYEEWRTNRLKSRGNHMSVVANGRTRQQAGAGSGVVAGRSVSTAAAYGGKGLGAPLGKVGSASTSGQSGGARAVSANEIGVAVPVSNGTGPRTDVTGNGGAAAVAGGRENGFGGSPLAPRALYRGVGTY